jgi:hypothetical protein
VKGDVAWCGIIDDARQRGCARCDLELSKSTGNVKYEVDWGLTMVTSMNLST